MSKRKKSRSSLKVSKGSDGTTHLGTIQQLALLALEEEKFDEALAWVERALRVAESVNEPAVIANCNELAAFLLEKQGRHTDALERAELARAIWVEQDALLGVASCDSLMAYILHADARLPEARAKLLNSQQLLLEIGDYEEAARCGAVMELWEEGVTVGLDLKRDDK